MESVVGAWGFMMSDIHSRVRHGNAFDARVVQVTGDVIN